MANNIPHDLPPCPKVVVKKEPDMKWLWRHYCPWRGHEVGYGGYSDQQLAYRDALAHANHCFQQ